MPKTAKPKLSANQKITNQMIAMIEESGKLPWEKPWNSISARPTNFTTQKPYKGGNAMILAFAGMVKGYSTMLWASFNQFKKKGGFVQKGQKGITIKTPIIETTTDPITGEKSSRIKYFSSATVFNIEQTDLEVPVITTNTIQFAPIEKAEEIVANYTDKPRIIHGGDEASYNSITDFIRMPHPNDSKANESYYGTLFHELVHSTGHSSRLNREGIPEVCGSSKEEYSFEELVAEFGACFLQSSCNILTVKERDNSAAYLKGWLSALKDDSDLLMTAAAQAESATKYITKN